MIINKTTRERTKMFNPHYFEKQIVQSMDESLFFRYLCFSKINKLKEYIDMFPESLEIFNEYQKHFDIFIDAILKSYLDYFVFKKVSYISVRYYLPILYLHNNINKKERITREMVEIYIKNLEPHIIIGSFFNFETL
jgi:hypothetical protein